MKVCFHYFFLSLFLAIFLSFSLSHTRPVFFSVCVIFFLPLTTFSRRLSFPSISTHSLSVPNIIFLDHFRFLSFPLSPVPPGWLVCALPSSFSCVPDAALLYKTQGATPRRRREVSVALLPRTHHAERTTHTRAHTTYTHARTPPGTA